MIPQVDLRLAERAHALGFDLVGVCDPSPPKSLPILESWIAEGMHGSMEYMQTSLPLRADLNTILPGVQSVLAVGMNYYQEPSGQTDANIARYALGRDYHKVIRSRLKKLADQLQVEHPTAQFRPCVDSAPVMEREYAHRAGLGWFGKNTCLINSHRGSWFLIGVLLTTLEIERNSPAHGGCGTCRACIDACPTGAIIHRNNIWQVDATQCISYLSIEHKGDHTPEQAAQLGDWTFGCDVCQEVCPFNQPRPTQPLRAQTTSIPDFLAHRAWPNLTELAQIDEAQWDALTQGSPVRRAGLDGLRRNAQANLANQTAPEAPRTDSVENA